MRISDVGLRAELSSTAPGVQRDRRLRIDRTCSRGDRWSSIVIAPYCSDRMSSEPGWPQRFMAGLVACLLGLTVPTGCDFSPDASNGPSTLDGVIVDEEPSPADESLGGASVPLSFVAGAAFCCSPLSIEFDAILGPGISQAGVTYAWSFGDGRRASGPHVEHDYPWAGDYLVRLTATLPDDTVLITTEQLRLVIDDLGQTQVVIDPDSDGGNTPLASPDVVVADAGADFTLTSGDLGVLDGSGTYLPGPEPARFLWVQIDGPHAILNSDDQPVVSFTAPNVGSTPADMVFLLTVTQGPLVDDDEVRVTIEPGLIDMAEATTPTAFDQLTTVGQGVTTTIVLGGFDADDDPLTFLIVTPPPYGSLGPIVNTGPQSASVDYTPGPEFAGLDSFTFIVTDGLLDSNVATVSIEVLADARAPEARDVSLLGRLNRGVTVDLAGVDPDGDAMTFEIVQHPNNGVLSGVIQLSPSTAQVVYTPNVGFEGTDHFYFRADDGGLHSPAALASVRVIKEILPWTEINIPQLPATDLYTEAQGAVPGMTLADYCVVGLQSWATIADRAIVTTNIGHHSLLYPELSANGPPGVQIIGGLKTSLLPGTGYYDPELYDFTDAAGWQTIAQAATEIAAMTGVNIVVLENETSLTPYHRGWETIDYAALAVSLQALEDTGIEFWWWFPNVFANSVFFPGQQAQTTMFVQTVRDAVPGSVFLTSYHGWEYWHPVQDLAMAEIMLGLVGQPNMQEGLFVTSTGWWEYANDEPVRGYTAWEAVDAFSAIGGETMRVYPPGGDWILVAQQFDGILPTLGRLVDP